MIWIPKKEDCITWNETEDGIYILYFYDGNDTRELPIHFFWGKTPKEDKNRNIYYEMDHDPFYLSVDECMRDRVLACPLNACSCLPQLRYNKIINKWFCNCASSAICTKNDDQSELDELLALTKEYDYEHGFCDNPIEAILKWNEGCAKDYENIAKENIKEFKKLMKENDLKKD